jgi:Tfp pilus assembly protein PilN
MIRINLSPSVTQKRRLTLRLPGFNLGIVFAIVYVAAGGTLVAYWSVLAAEERNLVTEVDRAQREIDSLRAVIGQAGKVKEQLAELQKRVRVITDLSKDQTRPVRLVDAFVDTVPRNVWITSLDEKASLLKIAGGASSAPALGEFMTNLRKSGRFQEVDIVVSRQDLAKTSSPVTFEVTCKFGS